MGKEMNAPVARRGGSLRKRAKPRQGLAYASDALAAAAALQCYAALMIADMAALFIGLRCRAWCAAAWPGWGRTAAGPIGAAGVPDRCLV
jgi:hypothetical protein